MFFCNGFHQLFTLFSLIFVKVQCDQMPGKTEKITTVKLNTTFRVGT